MVQEKAGKRGHQDAHQPMDPAKCKKKKHQSGGHKMHLFKADWHKPLRDDQKIKVDGMHIQLMKETVAIKADINGKKIEFAALATEDRADAKTIQIKIDEILEVKRQKRQMCFGHIVEMRKILSQEQRLSYDMLIVGPAAEPRK
ncbi:hypothetical protein JYT92_00270 [bacterium AH-315-L15]|nr:hypothetical protein [bacterium AH-315-L15]